MQKSVILILVGNRKEAAVNVQKVMTGWGCNIKTRLGIHDGVLDNCSDQGLIILEVVGDLKHHEELTRKLNLIKHVNAKIVTLEVED